MAFPEGGGGGLRKNPFCGGGIDIFKNYTICMQQAGNDTHKLTPFW